MSGLLSSAALIVATAQLQVTDLLITAMRTADRNSQPTNCPFDTHPNEHPSDRSGPAAIVEFHHSAQHAQRPWSTRCFPTSKTKSILDSPYPAGPGPRLALQPGTPRVAELGHPLGVSPTELPIQAPWKVLPWQNPPPPAQTVKIRPHHTDVEQTGMLLDIFV